MSFFVARNGEMIGEFTEADFRERVFNGEVQPEDHYWVDGMGDWQSVSAYRAGARTQRLTSAPEMKAPIAPKIATTTLEPIARVKRQNGLSNFAGFGMSALAMFLPLVSPLLFFVSIGLLVASFVLGIVAIIKGKLVLGVALMAFVPLAGIGSCVYTLNRDEMLDPAKRQGLIEGH